MLRVIVGKENRAHQRGQKEWLTLPHRVGKVTNVQISRRQFEGAIFMLWEAMQNTFVGGSDLPQSSLR